MPESIQGVRTQFVSLDTDFGYDALGGVGRLGAHRMEVLETGVRRTDRIPGPPKTVGRWFAKLLDRITPSSWRAQGRFRRGLEDFSAETGRVLGYLRGYARMDPSDPERRVMREHALRELAGLRPAADSMTRMGTDYAELLQTRVRRNMAILREENPQLMQELVQLKRSGVLDELLAELDSSGQEFMAEDLGLIRDALHTDAEELLSRVEMRTEELEVEEVGEPVAETPAERPYHSRFSASSLGELFFETFTFKRHAQHALRERQKTLDRFVGEAENSVRAALREVNTVLRDGLVADSDSFFRVQEQVDAKMGDAIHCAMNEVCDLALRHMDHRESTGQEGQDFRRIEVEDVLHELETLERAVQAGEEMEPPTAKTGGHDGKDLTDPFREAIRKARRQIRDISRLYGELTEGLGELDRRSLRFQSCLLLQETAQATPPEGVSRQEFGETCDALIEALYAPVPGNLEAESALNRLRRWMESESMPQSLRERFMNMLPKLERGLSPDAGSPAYGLPGTAGADAGLVRLERARALHRLVGDAGALLQRSGLPQADSLISQGLQVSRLSMLLRKPEWGTPGERQQAIEELRASVSRLMANLALARMQTMNPTIRSAQPEAGKLDGNAALEGLRLFQRSMELLVSDLKDEEGGTVARAAMNAGLDLVEKGEKAAQACKSMLVNRMNKELDVAEQLAVCIESGRDDVEAVLQGMMEGSRWNKGKHSEAKRAITEFLDALRPVTESRGRSELLHFLDSRLAHGKDHNIVPHDVYMGIDGSIHMLINTDRLTMTGASKKIQGVRWIVLPPPDRLPPPGVSTGVNRLDEMLKDVHNRTVFYPQLHQLLTEYFSGTRYDFSLE